MRVYAIDHVQLAMPPGEEDRARRFYTGLLELPEIPKPPQLAPRGGVWFERQGLKVHLGVESDFHPARKAHPAFLVEGLDEIIQRCQASEVDLVFDVPLEGYRRVHVTDPFGNRIELLEILP